MGVVKIQELPYKVMGSCYSAHKTVIADALASHVIIGDHSVKQASSLASSLPFCSSIFPLCQVATMLTSLIVKVGVCHVHRCSSFEKTELGVDKDLEAFALGCC